MTNKQNFLGINVRNGRKFLGLSQAEFAKKCDVSQQLINAIEAGTITETSKLLTIAMAFGLHAETLLAYKIDWELEYNTRHDRLRAYNLPVLDFNQIDDFLAGKMPESFIKREKLMLPIQNLTEKAFILTIQDNSMDAVNTPKALARGEKIVVDKTSEEKIEKIYLIEVPEGKKIRKLDQDGDVKIFTANNDNFPTHNYDNAKIIGKVLLKYTLLD